MSKINILPSFLVIMTIFVFTGCEDKFTESFTANVPVYKSYEDWRNEEIAIQAPQDISEAGKVYIYGSYLLVNDRFKGLHIFDNSAPSSPVNLGFLPIHGNINMAVRNDRLYVDSYTDLLTFDLSDISSPQLTCRVEDVFNFTAIDQFDGYDKSLPVAAHSPDKGVVVSWKQEEVDSDSPGYYYGEGEVALDNSRGFAPNGGPSMSGIGGSMAQFTLHGSHLYTLEPNQLTSYDLSNADCPSEDDEIWLNRTAETIFPNQDHLFIGTTTGMLIYSLSDPARPSLVSEYDHISACDPVVVKDDRAYVTLRTGNTCFGEVNELIVINIADFSNPHEIKSYDMTNPHGLGIDGTTLFICDGSAGLKVYDASDDLNIDQKQIGHFQNITTYDVIPYNNILITSAEEGIYQYDYSDPSNLQQLSLIPVQ